MDYLTRWADVQPVKDCSTKTTAKFIFEFILLRFGCSKILMSGRGSHFLNGTIIALIEEFHMYHKKSMPYHPKVIGTIKAFKKILENALKGVYNVHGMIGMCAYQLFYGHVGLPVRN